MWWKAYPWCTETFYTCTRITIEVAVFVRLLQFLRLKSHKDFPGSLKAPFSQVIKCYYNYYNPINECSSFNSSTLTVQVVVSFWPADLLHGWTNLNNNKKKSQNKQNYLWPWNNRNTCCHKRRGFLAAQCLHIVSRLYLIVSSKKMYLYFKLFTVSIFIFAVFAHLNNWLLTQNLTFRSFT